MGTIANISGLTGTLDASSTLFTDLAKLQANPNSVVDQAKVNADLQNLAATATAVVPGIGFSTAFTALSADVTALVTEFASGEMPTQSDIVPIFGNVWTILGQVVTAAGLSEIVITDGVATLPGVSTITVGTVMDMIGASITAWSLGVDKSDISANLTSFANVLQMMASNTSSQIDEAISSAFDTAASSSTFANWVSFLLGNAQNQTDDENDPFGVDDPLVISTNGHAVTTTSLANGAYVDYRGTGFEEQSSWFSSNAGILVDVTNPNGTLNNGFTIIGSSTTNQNGNVQGQTGFTQLAALDTNHDGVINASDTDFSQIEILVGSNGQSGSGHLETLAQAGITSISLSTTAVNTTDANGDKTLATSAVTYSNGTTGTLSDMNMSVNTSNTIDESAGTVNSAYANLPDVAGWGDVHNLQVAMAA